MKKRVTELEEEVKKYKDELDKALKRASAQPDDEVRIDVFLTSVGRPGYCHSPVVAVENVDVRQPILLRVASDGVNIS